MYGTCLLARTEHNGNVTENRFSETDNLWQVDFAQAYHQAALTLATKKYTSFILYSGVYQFTRLPSGLKQAPSYFQEMIATEVLNTLLYRILEIYIDDVNVFGNSPEDFVTRLREFFSRIRLHKMILQPSKCYLGYADLQFVGKVISQEGLRMSQSNIQLVLDLPCPTVSKQLKSFLGLVNYFRDFIRNQSTIVRPLHALLTNYQRTKRIVWTPEATSAFNEIKEQVSKCTTIHFISDTAPITLHTDASDYGIGGYLFQTIDGKDYPVAFVSKSLSGSQLRWSTIQKEAYAIYYSCIFLQSLLRDRLFTIRTDHRNLLYIYNNSNPMIVRWYVALSEYTYKIEFIKGVDNDIADSMSRLCRNNMIDSPKEYSADMILAAAIIPKIQLTDMQYNAISSVHNSMVGHFGLARTMKRLKANQHKWEFMENHVRYFIDFCPQCQKMSMIKIPIHAHPFTTSSYYPMECLNIDFVGPFPDGGHILVIIDTFTRWTELYHTTDSTALSAAQCLIQHFGRFGAPHQLRSDNGPHFIADVIREFLSFVGTRHCLTLAYSKEENAIVERMNKEINRHIRSLTYDNTSLEDYKLALPFVMRIINSNHSDRLKISSAQLLFGNCVNLDRGMFRPIDEVPPSKKSMSVYMSNLLKTQDSLRKAAAKELLRTDLLHMTHKKQLQHTDYQPGTYVLVHYRTGHPPTRLHTFWRGPMRVISGSNSRFTLYDLISHVEKEYHVSDMKPFLFDPLRVEPLDVARHDYMEFYIENILEHRGDLQRKTSLEFLVKWLGYADEHNSWTSYANLRDTEKLHEYLTSNNLQRLIPTKFTNVVDTNI